MSGSPVLRGNGLKSTLVTPLPNGFRVGHRQFTGTTLDIVPERSPAVWVADHQYRGRVRLVRQRNEQDCRRQRRAAGGLHRQRRRRRDARRVSRRGPAGAGHRRPVVRALPASRAPVPARFSTSSLRRAARTMAAISTGAATDAAMRPNRNRAGTRPVKRRASSACATGSRSARITRPSAADGRSAARPSSTTRARPCAPVDCPWCHDAELFRWTQELPLERGRGPAAAILGVAGEAVRRSGVDSSHGPHRRDSRADLRDRATAAGAIACRPSISADSSIPRNVPSYQFEAKIADGLLVLEGRGHGHGVGLCQWGARGMAEAGSGPLAILRHYYPGRRSGPAAAESWPASQRAALQ